LLMIKAMFSSLLGGSKYRGELAQWGVDRTSRNLACTEQSSCAVTRWSWISDILLHFETAPSRASSKTWPNLHVWPPCKIRGGVA